MRWEKVILYSLNPAEIRPHLAALGYQELPNSRAEKPDLVVSHGGDGTFFTAEREWPGVPKLICRRSRVCNACQQNVPRLMLEHLRHKPVNIREYPKILFSIGLSDEVAVNDIILRNWNPNQALRFAFEATRGGDFPQGEIIGDGFVVATRIGARAYYRSITRQEFKSHFGLAFNNPTKSLDPIDLSQDFSLTVNILRENGLLCLDNLPSFMFLRAGDRFTVRPHSERTRVIDLPDYYCTACRAEVSIS